MCNSAAEGGQRCHAHTGIALAGAETRQRNATKAIDTFISDGQPVPPVLRAKELQAAYDLTDARARHASTPQGAADLDELMAHTLPGADDLSAANPNRTLLHAYAEALSEGKRIRYRASEAHAGVKTGTMTGNQAATLTQYPSQALIAERLTHINAVLPQLRPYQPPQPLAALKTAARAVFAKAQRPHLLDQPATSSSQPSRDRNFSIEH